MNLPLNLRILAVVSAILVLFKLPAMALAWHMNEPMTPFVYAVVLCLGVSVLGLLTRHASLEMQARDGVLAVIIGWAVMIFMGALPYYFSGQLRWVDAVFESASGFTTTGSSILPDVEALSQSLLFWRSTTQWIGGMGILLLAVAILPFLGVGGAQIMKAEMPGPRKDKLAPRMAATAQLMWGIYVGLTVLCGLAYYVAGMSGLDAVHHAFTTIAIGGFSTKNASLAAYSSTVQWTAMFFMIVAGINFVMHYRLIVSRDVSVFRDEEIVWYLLLMLVAGVFCTLIAHASTADKAMEPALRHGFFQAISLVTNTGFANVDWETWPLYVQLLLMTIAIPGAMAGSTTGGLKMVRAVILFKVLGVVLNRLLTPERVMLVKFNGKKVPRDILDGVMAMAFAMALALLGATIFLVAFGMDVPSAYSAALTATINVGPGIGWVGPMDNFSAVPDPGKYLLVALMVFGRLEVFTVLILLLPHFWKPEKVLVSAASPMRKR